MEEKKIQLLFKKIINGNSIITLKDGKIIFFSFRNSHNFDIYDEKTFKRLFQINLYEIILQYENENKKDKNIFNFYLYYNKNSIKELKSGLILVGLDKFLFQLKLNKKDYDCKIVKQINDIILDINELTNKKIIIITKNNIIKLCKKYGEYIVINEFLIKEYWKILPHMSMTEEYNRHFHQYYSSYLLPNNKLLLYSFSNDLYNLPNGRIVQSQSISNSKIIFINLKNYKEISSAQYFREILNIMILENYLIIHSHNFFNI